MIVLFALYAAIGAAHILAILTKNEFARRLSKVFLIPPLAAAYAVSNGVDLFPIAALVFGWLGDILLLKNSRNRYFILGLVSFLLGHLCYMAAFSAHIQALDGGALLAACAAALVFGVFAFRCVRPPAKMVFPVIVYMAVIESLVLAALQLLIPRAGFPAALIFAGCLCFITSDLTLGYYTFRPRPKAAGVAIMALYIAAQGSITLGLVLLS